LRVRREKFSLALLTNAIPSCIIFSLSDPGPYVHSGASILAVPAGMYFATLTEAPLAVIGTAVVFLPLYVFILLRVHQDWSGWKPRQREGRWEPTFEPEGGEDQQVFDPKLIREAREVDAGAGSKNPDGFFSSSSCPSCSSSDIEIIGKNEHAKSVFWALFLVLRVIWPETWEELKRVLRTLTGLVLARIADPVTAQKVIGVRTGAEG
jgi:hypothetical protein